MDDSADKRDMFSVGSIVVGLSFRVARCNFVVVVVVIARNKLINFGKAKG